MPPAPTATETTLAPKNDACPGTFEAPCHQADVLKAFGSQPESGSRESLAAAA